MKARDWSDGLRLAAAVEDKLIITAAIFGPNRGDFKPIRFFPAQRAASPADAASAVTIARRLR